MSHQKPVITKNEVITTNEVIIRQFTDYLDRQGKTKQTARAYIADVRKLAEFLQRSTGAATLAEAPTGIVEAFIQQSSASPSSDSTLKRQVMGLRRFCSFLVESGLMHTNPMSAVAISNVPAQVIPIDKLERVFRYLCQRQVSEDAIETLRYCRDELVLIFMLFLGILQSRIPSLRISGLKKENGSYFIVTGLNDSQKLDGMTLHLLHAYLKGRQSNGDTIFIDPTGKRPVTVDDVRSLMSELSFAAGCPVNPKTIRHTHELFQSSPSEADRMLKLIADMHTRRDIQ